MVDIKCLVCEESLEIPPYIDPADYDGQLVCQECKSLLHVKLVKGKVQKYKIVEKKFGDFNFSKLAIRMQEERNQQEKEE